MMVPTLNSFHLAQNLPNALLIVYSNAGPEPQFVYPVLFVQHLRNNAKDARGGEARREADKSSPIDGPTGLELETDCHGPRLFVASGSPLNS